MNGNDKITNFHEAKKRVGASKDSPENKGKDSKLKGYERALAKQKGHSVGSSLKWHHYLRFVLFLVLVAWFMKSCSL